LNGIFSYGFLYHTKLRGDLIDLLISKGGDPTARDEQGRDAYSTAAFYNREAIMKRFDADSPASRFGRK
jgi:ankyrin repeat protein